MKLNCFILLLFLPFFALCQTADSLLFEKASRLYDSDKFEPALKEVNSLIGKDHNQAKYFSLRGQIHYKLNKRTQAIDDFTKAISLEASNPLHYHYRAIVFYSVQEPDYSIEDNNAALSRVSVTDSLYYSLLLNRGNAYAMKRDFQKAYQDYFDVLKFDSTNQGALTNIGAVLDELERSEEAIAYLEKVVRYYPDFVGGYGNLAFRYADKGDYKKALELNNKVLELDPDEPLGYNNRGYVKYKLNDLKGALQDINKSIKMYPSNSYAYRNRALVYIALKEKEKACLDLRKAIELGFSEMYGDEVQKLQDELCLK